MQQPNNKMKDPVSIKVQFVFDAGDPWSRVYDFENDIKKFLNERDFDGDCIRNIGNQGEMIIFVRQRTMVEKALPNQPVKPPSQQIKELKK